MAGSSSFAVATATTSSFLVSRICGYKSSVGNAYSASAQTHSNDEIADHSGVVREEKVEQARDDGDRLEVVTEEGKRPGQREERHRGGSVHAKVSIEPVSNGAVRTD